MEHFEWFAEFTEYICAEYTHQLITQCPSFFFKSFNFQSKSWTSNKNKWFVFANNYHTIVIESNLQKCNSVKFRVFKSLGLVKRIEKRSKKRNARVTMFVLLSGKYSLNEFVKLFSVSYAFHFYYFSFFLYFNIFTPYGIFILWIIITLYLYNILLYIVFI